MALNFQEIAEKVVHKTQKMGADMSEAFIINSKDLSIEVREQKVDTMKLAEERGAGVRVIKDDRMGFAYTSDLSDSALDDIIQQALANSEKTTADQYNRMPEVSDRYPELDLFDAQIGQVSVEDKINLAKTVEDTARKYDQRVSIIEASAYSDAEYEVTLFNSRGVKASYRGTYCGAYISLVAGSENDNQNGFGLQYTLKYSQLNPEVIGREGAEKAVRMLEAQNIPTTRATVVLDPYIATSFLGVLSPALSAEAVQKGKSLFAGKVGQKVASELINIIDDGAMPGGIASAPFDGEGVPTQKTVLMEKGHLKGYLYNTYTAAKDGVKSTGNGTRGTFKSTPEVGTTNFYIAPGNKSQEELIKEISKGLYVTEVMGMHTANPISGDFSVGAAGLWIENGEITKPVRGVAIAGNILELLESIDCVGSDLRFFGGSGAPTVRISQMTISGS